MEEEEAAAAAAAAAAAPRLPPPPPSDYSTPDMGIDYGHGKYCRGGRSVLHHPAGLPHIRTLHSQPRAKTVPEEPGGDGGTIDNEAFPLIRDMFPDFFPASDGADEKVTTTKVAAPGFAKDHDFDKVFQKCHDA